MAASKKKPALDFEAEAGSPPASNAVQKLSALIKEVSILAATMEELEESLKTARSRYNEIKMRLMPDIMAEAGVSEWKDTETGIKTEIKKFVSGSLPKDEPARSEALDWMNKNDGGSLLSTEISVEFKKSEHNLALSVFDDLKEQGLQPSITSTIHAGTLQKWVRERMAGGEEVPLDKLGLYGGTIADITLPSTVKGQRGKKL